MTIPLASLARCFQGVVPCIVATCAADGTPNVIYASQVYFVDDRHVALSCQFFNKTRRNLDDNPHAAVQIYDPVTFDAYQLRLRFDHSETAGPLFDDMALRIAAIASQCGMTGVFRLRSADVFEVDAVERIDDFLEPIDGAAPPIEDPAARRGELRGLQVISERICRAVDLDQLLATTLASLDELFGFRHSLVLVADDDDRLVTIASHGYDARGIGAEVALGEGLIGTVGRERRLLRVGGVGQELRYGRAIRERIEATGGAAGLRPEIPLPGLADAHSQMAMPLVVEDRLVGVIAVESRDPLSFDEWHEAFLQIVANQIAIGIDRMVDDEPEDDLETTTEVPLAASTRRFCFYRNDDCVFVDDEYLIRNVPGKILWKLLTAYQRDGRREFANRELRLDPWLGLPPIKDNLESRLILLRRR
ncbi:MAG: GAF domain-containing protein, partial [Myxococcales bacterium]|nr:GAF domain-containing protein [Myxococcales bacterium]